MELQNGKRIAAFCQLACVLMASLALPLFAADSSARSFARGDPVVVLVYAGNNQSAQVGTAVTGVVCAQVLDASGLNVADGTTVTFAVASGGGKITGESPTTTKGLVTLGSWTLGPTPGVNTLIASCAAAKSVTFSATATAQSSTTLVFASGPTANPSAPTAGQIVTFTVSVTGGSGPLTFTWSFGDGPASATGPSVAHTYTLPGTFNATVTVGDGSTSIYSPLAVTVTSSSGGGGGSSTSIIGSGPDSDGDGFSDSFEALYGTNPSDTASTPINNVKISAPSALALLAPAIKLNFMSPGNDSIKFKGSLAIPANYLPTDQKVFVVVGNVLKSFVLTSKATSKSGGDALTIAIKSNKGVVAQQSANFTVTLSKDDLASKLADWGLTNSDISGAVVNVPFFVYFNGSLFGQSQALKYSAKKGKSGSAM